MAPERTSMMHCTTHLPQRDRAPRSRLSAWLVAAVVALLVLAMAASLLVGEFRIDGADRLRSALLHYDAAMTAHVIVRDWRLPRAVADVLVGARRWRWPGRSCRRSRGTRWPAPASWA